jgi:hypothetical protein
MARSRSKYDSILSRLSPAPPHDRQDDINEYKATVKDVTPVGLANAYILARTEKDLLELKLREVNLRVAALEQMLTASQDGREPGWGQYGVGLNSLRLASGDTIRIERAPYGQVVDREAYRQWCIKNGYERQLMLWPSRTNTIVKERLLAGEPEPDGVTAFSQVKVVFTPAGE